MAIVETWDYTPLAMEDDPDDYRPDSKLALIIDPAQSPEGFMHRLTALDERIAPGDRIPLHQHTIEEVVFVDEGHVEVRLGAEHRLVTPREVVFMPAGVAHGFREWGRDRRLHSRRFPSREITIRYLERNPAPGTEGDDPRPPVAFDVRELVGGNPADAIRRIHDADFRPVGEVPTDCTARGGRMRTPILSLLLTLLAPPAAAQERLPILDVHLHAVSADHLGPTPVAICTPMPYPAWDPSRPYGELFGELARTPPCPDPVWSPMTDEALMNETIEVMERLNIVGVLSGEEPERIATWMAAAPGRFIPGLVLGFGPAGAGFSTDSLRSLHAAGRLAVLGEMINQYTGIAPDDERMEAYWALAEELDIPVGIHVGSGPPGAIYLGASGYRARLHSPLTMEEVLVRHPSLRVYLMHAGYPMLDDLLAVLYAHPQVYVDVGIIVFQQPREEFYRYLRGVVQAGFGDRVMFGSDQMVWPGVIERAIAVIEDAPFLSEQQKRDILYNNAARFLRLSEEEIARHHGRGRPTGWTAQPRGWASTRHSSAAPDFTAQICVAAGTASHRTCASCPRIPPTSSRASCTWASVWEIASWGS